MRRSEEIARNLAGRIARGELLPGQRLLTERELAHSLGASRGCVREALRALAEQGLVRSRHGDGTYVAGSDGLAQALAGRMAASRRRLADIFEVRKMLEPETAALAAMRARPADLARLKALVLDQQRRQAQGQDDADLDAAFHAALAQASGNAVLPAAIAALEAASGEARGPRTQARRRASLAGHLALVAALERRDAEAARAAMDHHLAEVRREALAAAPDPLPKEKQP
jgi:GntR family transcriptional regulator, transcriptional repressor for pyruvate dehydrogenase complex